VKTRKTALLSLILIMLFAAPIMLTTQVHADENLPPVYDMRGKWTWNYYAGGNTYVHTMYITQFNSSSGAFNGTESYNNVSGYLGLVTGIENGTTVTFHDQYVGANSGYSTDAMGLLTSATSMKGTAMDSNGLEASWNASADVSLTFPPGSTAEVSIITCSTPPSFTFGGEEQLTLQPLSFGTVCYPLPGIIGVYYDVSIIGGSFSGQVQICVHYDPALLAPGSNPNNLRLCIYDPVDFNGDGTVNGQDIALMQKAIKSGYNDPRFDINHDGFVNNADLLIVKQFASHGLIVNHGQNGLSQARLPWMDITFNVDTENHVICGVTDHFSVFGVH
jgi:hypothetical protein